MHSVLVCHWCHYTVTRTVSCQVQNGSETVIQRVYQSCRWPGPCANLVRTLIRPTYKIAYRTVTALEWRCCPGFTGSNCEEECMNCTKLTDMTERLTILEAKEQNPQFGKCLKEQVRLPYLKNMWPKSRGKFYERRTTLVSFDIFCPVIAVVTGLTPEAWQ
ncbi:PREDICTED: collagen alpha-1(XXVI) chain-like [Thamnophis sirtalis]|uniref:Collagen alpha-1(XXVI) chain-like n=1 Tax=Thamnophis sirtalis TaxID=35019 RepID=A0A6I9Y2A8_9SAUR|nr:PREDICTED: collagen alpha-1(XXVI) chain-like [Thamnophis sirtalis]